MSQASAERLRGRRRVVQSITWFQLAYASSIPGGLISKRGVFDRKPPFTFYKRLPIVGKVNRHPSNGKLLFAYRRSNGLLTLADVIRRALSE